MKYRAKVKQEFKRSYEYSLTQKQTVNFFGINTNPVIPIKMIKMRLACFVDQKRTDCEKLIRSN